MQDKLQKIFSMSTCRLKPEAENGDGEPQNNLSLNTLPQRNPLNFVFH